MKVILMSDIKNVGKKDEIINASDGYARNFLFPKKLAVEANTENMAKLADRKNSFMHKKNLELEDAKKQAEEIKKIVLQLKVKVGENGKIFGGVTSKEITEELKKQYKIEVDKKKVILNETIKTIGNFNVDIKLYEGVSARLVVRIDAE